MTISHGSGDQMAKTTTPPKNPDIKDVWIAYKKNPTEPLRNQLMVNYLHLVRYNAERIHVKLPDEVELDDLMSAGIFGLMDAINAFDLERGVKFETYCAGRISSTAPASSSKSSWAERRRMKKSPAGSKCRCPSSRKWRRTPRPSGWS